MDPENETLKSGLWTLMVNSKLPYTLRKMSATEQRRRYSLADEKDHKKKTLLSAFHEIEHCWGIPSEKRSHGEKMKLAIFLCESIGLVFPLPHLSATTQLSFLLRILSHITVLHLEAQRRICTQGELGDAFFVVISGTLAILKKTSTSSTPMYCDRGNLLITPNCETDSILLPGVECLNSTKEVLYTSTVTTARKACVLRVSKVNILKPFTSIKKEILEK